MKCKVFIILFFLMAQSPRTFGQTEVPIHVTYAPLAATYNFIQRLSDYYPDNVYKQIFDSSEYNTSHYRGLLAQLDTLYLNETLPFEGYPFGHKQPLQTLSLLQKNLITAPTGDAFIAQSFGILPNDRIFAFTNILRSFEPVYDQLIYQPHQADIDKKVSDILQYIEVNPITSYFEKGLQFYGTTWDSAVPLEIAIIPILEKGGFTATAFLNHAISEVPLNFKQNDVLFSVLLHEIFHLQWDGQPLKRKNQIAAWFSQSESRNSQYASLLLDEALATALGNGYVFEQLHGKPDLDEWYNVPYIDRMAHEIYPMVKEYIQNKKTIDANFIKQYIQIFDTHFSDWTEELDFILTYRYILTDDHKDFRLFRKNYRYASKYIYSTDINPNSLSQLRDTPITKVIIVSEAPEEKLQWIKDAFPELENWRYQADKEFIHTVELNDKTILILINNHNGNFKQLLNDYNVQIRKE